MISLLIGPQLTLTQNVVYALPARRCILTTISTGATVLQSNDPDFATSVAVDVTTDGTAEVNAGFIKCTSGNIVVTLKAA